jgi:ubiquinone/menaquinone biosynthesis C-methylase UbiE
MINPVHIFYESPHFECLDIPKPLLEYLSAEEGKLKNSVFGGSVLDLGCGNGRVTNLLSNVSNKVTGVDFSDHLRSQAKINLRDKSDIELYLEDAKSMHFKDASFDYVVMAWNTFGNLYFSRDRILQESLRVLKPDGKLFLSVFSENVLQPYFEMLEKSRLNVVHYDENYVFLKEGLVSERFSESKLEHIFKKAKVKSNITKLTEISYWCELTK